MPNRPLCHSYQAQMEQSIAAGTETVRNRGSDKTMRVEGMPDAINVYTHTKENKGSNRAVSEELKDEPVVFAVYDQWNWELER